MLKVGILFFVFKEKNSEWLHVLAFNITDLIKILESWPTGGLWGLGLDLDVYAMSFW